MSRLRIMLVGALGVIAISAAACGDGPPTSAGGSSSAAGPPIGAAAQGGTPTTIIKQVAGQKFDPAGATVKVKDVVEWQNTDQIPHNVTFDGHDEVTNANMNAGDKFEVTFSVAGTYKYHCTYHPGMDGTLTVNA
jgi:plastocyanin